MYQPDEIDWQIIEYIQDGLELIHRPYAQLARQLCLNETELIARIENLQHTGIIKRFGIVIHHRRLGYKANGMVVWDIPDQQLIDVGKHFTQFKYVTLCYQRPRHLPQWSYNLFTMIHGFDREQVITHVEVLNETCGRFPHEILFSQQCFKQCGAHYVYQKRTEA